MYQRRINKPRRVIHSIDELPAICDCCDVGLYLRLNPEVVARMARDGVLRGAKQGQSWRFRKGHLLSGPACYPAQRRRQRLTQRGAGAIVPAPHL